MDTVPVFTMTHAQLEDLFEDNKPCSLYAWNMRRRPRHVDVDLIDVDALYL